MRILERRVVPIHHHARAAFPTCGLIQCFPGQIRPGGSHKTRKCAEDQTTWRTAITLPTAITRHTRTSPLHVVRPLITPHRPLSKAFDPYQLLTRHPSGCPPLEHACNTRPGHLKQLGLTKPQHMVCHTATRPKSSIGFAVAQEVLIRPRTIRIKVLACAVARRTHAPDGSSRSCAPDRICGRVRFHRDPRGRRYREMQLPGHESA